MINNDNDIQKIQQAALRVFKTFKDICDKHHLIYYAIGGTCIGAVRHSGFIPWDDDIDVAMPVLDYYRFIEICSKELSEQYALITPNNVKHYHSMYIKLQDTSTTFIEKIFEKYPDRYSGIFIDIFPIYGLPKNESKRNSLIKNNEKLKKYNLKLRFPICEEYGLKGKMIWMMLSPLRMVVPYYWATDKQQDLFRAIKFDSSEYVYFPWRSIPGSKGSGTYKNVFSYKDFCSSIEMPFEDTTISVPIGYHNYLTYDFGDYMTLPPVEKQIPCHHTAVIDLNNSYKIYVDKKENMIK